jgi:hypothetical protein
VAERNRLPYATSEEGVGGSANTIGSLALTQIIILRGTYSDYVRCYFPVNSGRRLPRNAAMPSCLSARTVTQS